MLRILLDPAQPSPGEYDHSFLIGTIIEQAVFQQLGRNSATINALRRGPHNPTEREKEHIINGWMPDVVIPIREASESELVKVTKTAGCCVEYLPVELPANHFNRQEMEDAMAAYYAIADKIVAGLKKSFAAKLPQEEPVIEEPVVEEPVAEEPVAEEPAAEEPVDATEETTESAG